MEVERQAFAWNAKWESKAHAGVAGMPPFLAQVPRPPRCVVDFTFDAVSLRKAAAKMKGKSPGPDSWTAEALTRLPLFWWSYAAKLWDKVVQCQQALPGLVAVIAPLWKDNDKTRPITILPVMWRAGARLINQWLPDLALSWKHSFDCGGLPAASVSTALQMLQRELVEGVVRSGRTCLATLTA